MGAISVSCPMKLRSSAAAPVGAVICAMIATASRAAARVEAAARRMRAGDAGARVLCCLCQVLWRLAGCCNGFDCNGFDG